MPYKTPLKISLPPSASYTIAAALVLAFSFASYKIIKSYPMAQMSALNYLRPDPPNYFWKITFEHAPIDQDQIRYYADYFKQFPQVFSSGIGDSYGILGFCNIHLHKKEEAMRLLRKAIDEDPYYFWYYYNVASLYIDQKKYAEAAVVLEKGLSLNPLTTLKVVTASKFYQSFVDQDDSSLNVMLEHLKEYYEKSKVLLTILTDAPNNREELIKRLRLEPHVF